MGAKNMPTYPPDARAVVNRYLDLVDRVLPGQIEGLYLVGSIALGDYRAGLSDVDFVAVSGNPLAEGELGRLQEIHRALRLHGKPWFDGIYVTRNDLMRNPTEIATVPFNLRETFGHTGGAEANPSVWLTLRNHPFAVRGPRAPVIWYDEAAIRQWNMSNLNSYWRGVADRLDSADAPDDPQSMDWETMWCVAGVTRLHYTITSLDVISKWGACVYALARFPDRWHTVIREAQAVRCGESAFGRNLDARRSDVRAFMRYVIEDASAHLSSTR